MRRAISRESWSLNAAGAVRAELSTEIATSALLRAGRLLDPEKITSSIDAARIDLCDDSPITQRNASTRFDLPHPFGPTTPVKPGSIRKSVGSTKDLKPSRRSLVSFIASGPHCILVLAHMLRPSPAAIPDLREQRVFGSCARRDQRTRRSIRYLHSPIQQAFPGLGPVPAARLPHCAENESARSQGQLPCERRLRFSRPFGQVIQQWFENRAPYPRPSRPKNPYQPLR